MRITQTAGLGFCLALAITAGTAGTAAANTWPANIVGSYSGMANTALVQINITSQATGTPCVAVSGNLLDRQQGLTNPIVGYYCPKDGSLAFVRNDPTSGQTFQVYSGGFSVTMKGLSTKLAGTFGEYSDANNLGLYPFAVSK